MFGVDPVTGRRDHLVVEIVPAGPVALVSGTLNAGHHVMTRRGRLVESTNAAAAPPLTRPVRHRLAGMAARAQAAFGSPQDIEWAVDTDERLWLLQSRPVTATASADRHAVTFGTGPLAETFPNPLRTLEIDLWLNPLRDGIVRALRTSGAVPDRAIETSPVVAAVDGWAAADLGLLGLTTGHRGLRRWTRPGVILRRLGTAWRVGRIRVALPQLSDEVLMAVDEHLEAIPPLEDLDDPALADTENRALRELATVHCYEVLAGMLLPGDRGVPAALVALEALSNGRQHGSTDHDIVASRPEVLTLVPPSMDQIVLPQTASSAPTAGHTVADVGVRDALRLRTRWLQELVGRTARVAIYRCVERGRIHDVAEGREMSWEELRTALIDGVVPSDLATRHSRIAGPPLPSVFRRESQGSIRPLAAGGGTTLRGQPAGGGRAVGTVRHRVDTGDAMSGTILVTRHLEPSLAPLLAGLDGIVAETGSALSHLAILAREVGVPCVVGLPDALARLPQGSRVAVDGTTGDVTLVDDTLPGNLPEMGAP